MENSCKIRPSKKGKNRETRELILKLKILTVLPNHMKKLLWKLILDNYKEQDFRLLNKLFL